MSTSLTDFFEVEVKVVPRSSRNKVEWETLDSLKVWVMAAPTDGQANEAVIAMLAKSFKVPKSGVAILRGDTGRQKRIRIPGLTLDEAHNRLR